MRGIGLAPVVAIALLLSPHAASAANKEQQLLMAEVRMMQQQQQQLQQMIASLADTLKTVTGRLDEQAATSRKALADQRLLIENMSDTVRGLRERADDTNVRLSSMGQELEALRQAMASQPPPVAVPTTDPAADPSAPGITPTPGATPPRTTVAPPPGVSPSRTYDSAYSDYTGGQYDLAIVGFDTFLKFFPRDPRAPEAQFNIGNAYYNGGKYREAIAAYQQVISDYPKSDSVPSAYYKLGLSYVQLKQPDLARKAFQMILDNYPTAPEHTLARQANERLGK